MSRLRSVEEFGAFIRAMRLANGWRIVDVIDRLPKDTTLTSSEISRLENGKRPKLPAVEHLWDLGQVFDRTLMEMVVVNGVRSGTTDGRVDF